MNSLMPTTFLEALGGGFGFLSIIFLMLSFYYPWRSHAIRIFSVLVILSISFVANHFLIYFSALFIISTAATELEFLQNLAAIVRGNKEYFDYKKAIISKKDYEKIVGDSHE